MDIEDVPNKETEETIREAMSGEGLIKSDCLNDLYNELGI